MKTSTLRLLLLALAMPFHTAMAHPHLVRAAPSPGSARIAPPPELSLTFNEAVSVALCRVTLIGAANDTVPLDTLRSAPGDARTLTVALLGTLRPGRYVVRWQAAGADGHPMRGEYSFSVVTGAGQPTAATITAAPRPMPAGSTFGVRSPIYVAIRALQSIALVTLLGVLVMHALILPRFVRQADVHGPPLVAAIDQASTSWATTMLVVIGAVTAARLAAQHAVFYGTSAPWTRSALRALLGNSPWGHAWWLALAAMGVGLLGTHWIRRTRASGWLVLGAAALALVVSVAMSGHAAAGTTLALMIHALHVLGAGGWVGSLAALVLVAMPVILRSDAASRHARVADLVRAFSPTALSFAGLLVVTGMIAAWRNIGSVAGLWQSPYGQVLLLKLALLAVVAGTGAFNWKRVMPSLGSAAATRRLHRSAALEMAAALLVLVVTAVLVATPMPAEMLSGIAR